MKKLIFKLAGVAIFLRYFPHFQIRFAVPVILYFYSTLFVLDSTVLQHLRGVFQCGGNKAEI